MKVQAFGAWTALAAGFFFCTAPLAHADFYSHGWQRHRENRGAIAIKLEPLGAIALSNFDAYGARMLPSGFGNLWRAGGDLTLELGVAHPLTVYARMNWMTSVLNSSARSGLMYGFGDQSAGLNFKFPEFGFGRSQISLQAQVDFPLYSQATADQFGLPYLGDASGDFTGGIFWAQKIASFAGETLIGTLGGGYTFRTAGFSMAIPLSLIFELTPYKSGLLATFGAQGLISLKNDIYTASPALRSPAGSGGSAWANAVNPSLLSLGGGVGYQFSPVWSIWALAKAGIIGQSAPQVLSGSIALQLRLGATEGRGDFQLDPEQFNKTNQGFVQYSLDTKISKVQDRMNLAQIPRGADDGVEVGQLFDIFKGQGEVTRQEALARARVSAVRNKEAVLEVVEFFKEGWIDPGFLARRLVTLP